MSVKVEILASWQPSFVTSHVFDGLGKYPKLGPSLVSWFHHMCRSASLPVSAALSAYHIWFELFFNLLMRGMVARAYMDMVSGLPCGVPSWESRVSPSTNNPVGAWYVFMSMVASGGQSLLMFWSATW